MKKITVLLLLTLPALTGFGQSAKLTNAINYLKDYRAHNDVTSLNKAKENIDLIAQNTEAKDQAKIQKVKGDVYVALFENNLKQQTDKLTNIADPNERAFAGYKNTAPNELEEAVKAYKTAKGIDTKGIYAYDISNANAVILNHYFNLGNGNFTEKKYDVAEQMYEKASELDETNDSSLLNNLAASALYAEHYTKAKESYAKMAESKVGGAGTYNSLVQCYYSLKDSVGGIEVLKKGRLIYPNDRGLLDRETNYYLSKNKSPEALKNLNEAIAARPDEATLYVVRASVYDKIANPRDAKGSDLPKPADSDAKIKLAEADYKKAISIYEATYKPGSEDAIAYSETLFNLGLVYFNNAASISQKADRITDNAKFAVENKKANEEFMKALPYLEKSLELKPNDAQTMYALKQIYTRLEMTAKLKSINDKMKN